MAGLAPEEQAVNCCDERVCSAAGQPQVRLRLKIHCDDADVSMQPKSAITLSLFLLIVAVVAPPQQTRELCLCCPAMHNVNLSLQQALNMCKTV